MKENKKTTNPLYFLASSGSDCKGHEDVEFRPIPLPLTKSPMQNPYILLLVGSDKKSSAELQRSFKLTLERKNIYPYGERFFEIVMSQGLEGFYKSMLSSRLIKADVIILLPSDEKEKSTLEGFLSSYNCKDKPVFYITTPPLEPKTEKTSIQLIDSSQLVIEESQLVSYSNDLDVFLAISGEQTPSPSQRNRFIVSVDRIQYIGHDGSSQTLHLSESQLNSLSSRYKAVEQELIQLKKKDIGAISLLDKDKSGLQHDNAYLNALLELITLAVPQTNQANLLQESNRCLLLDKEILSPRRMKK